MVKGTTNLSFKYNDAGIRTQKTVNGVTTKYYLNGDKVTLEEKGTDKIYYTYDSTGNIVSMSLNGVEYFYIRNAQGDVMGLWDNTGTEVVTYAYDSWGKVISTTGELASTVGERNPYKYRGYRYDSETGLYYLQSRYYNPEWGRFINADAEGGKVGQLLSHNVFAYAINNPVNMSDPSGFMPTWAKWALGVVAVAVAIIALPAEVIAAAGTAVATASAALLSRVGPATQNVTQRAGPAVTRASQAVPKIGNKLQYVFGKATGSAHNIQRSLDMERQLNRIGIYDNPEGRVLVEEHLVNAFRNPSNISAVQENGIMVKESLLAGPQGLAKVESVWENSKLITVQIFGGK